MTEQPGGLTDRIADILWDYFAEVRRDGYIVDGVDGDKLAEAVVAVLPPSPPRQFVDDSGNRWEWCGGVEGTWKWRITDAS